MANLLPSLPALCTLLLLCLSSGGSGTLKFVDGQAPGQLHLDSNSNAKKLNFWCIAKPSTPDVKLIENIDFVCAISDCGIIKEGGPCFLPNTPMSHASVAMNMYFQSKGRNYWNCDFNTTGVLSVTDPSFDSCKFPFN